MSRLAGSAATFIRLSVPTFRFGCLTACSSRITSKPLCKKSYLAPSRTVFTMAARPHPFTQAVVSAMRSLYPEEIADRAWDNVGLLLENIAPADPASAPPPLVLLTNDVTPNVVDEAIAKRATVIVSYHPPIFRGLKSITLDDPQQKLLLRLVQSNIAVYSPHTAVDAAPGGLNDWLADAVTSWAADAGVTSTRAVAKPLSGPAPAGFEGAGYGRVCTYSEPVPLNGLVRAAATRLGGQRFVSVAAPRVAHQAGRPEPPAARAARLAAVKVASVAVCAGSGADVLQGADADVIVTGEMSHHAALRLTMLGKYVVTVFHSNSERAFLREVLRGKLAEALGGLYAGPPAEVAVSETDADPFEIWDVDNLA
ncbi:hypothetical protein RB595_007237 [Gaeumannomyces hyphopodioides]